jgi:tetratricopeptide (TPR) repeat protein
MPFFTLLRLIDISLNINVTTMKKSIILLISILVSFNLLGQSKIDSLIKVGKNYQDAGAYEKAIEYYLEALKLDPNSPVLNYKIAYSYMTAQDYVNSIKYSDIVIKLDNKNALSAYLTKGSSLDYLGKTDESIKVFEKAIKIFGDHYLLYYNLGCDYYKIKNKEKTEEALINALQSKSNHPSSHLLLAQLMADQNQSVQSILCLYYFLLLEPNTERSKTAINLLRKQFDGSVQKDKDKPNQINIVLNSDQIDSEFGAATMMLSIIKANNSGEENKGKSEDQLFIENTTSFFKTLGELKDKKKKGLWWNFYIPFFNDLANSDHMDTFCYFITQSVRESSSEWLKNNNPKLVLFDQWLNKK